MSWFAGYSFLVALYSAFSSMYTGYVALITAGFLAVVTWFVVHGWSRLWNTEWNGATLIISKLIVFVLVFVCTLLVIGVSHVGQYIEASATKLRTTLGTYQADWRRCALTEAYENLQKRGTTQRLPRPEDGGNAVEVRTHQDLTILANAACRCASNAVAEQSLIPVIPDPIDEDEARTLADRAGVGLPATLSSDNPVSNRALDAVTDRWSKQARFWCSGHLNDFQTTTELSAAVLIGSCMIICAVRAWSDIAA
jgi:hypothetical protein